MHQTIQIVVGNDTFIGFVLILTILLIAAAVEISAFFVNGLICYGILWIIPLFCLLSIPVLMNEGETLMTLPAVGLGVIWFYFFKLMLSVLGEILRGSHADESEVIFRVVRNSENVFPSIEGTIIGLVMVWVIYHGTLLFFYYREDRGAYNEEA